MYQKRVRNVATGETGIVVARPIQDCPNISVAPDYDARLTICWLKTDCQIVNK
jgi:hypothetical protein